MSDEMPQKLPRYVFRRANGSYRYKRNVPVGLRKLLGKDTIYRQLGNSYKEAMGNLPLVHGRIEALFDQEGEKSAKQRSLEIIRGALGEEVAELVLANAVPEYSEIEDDLNDLGRRLKKSGLPQAVVEQVYTGRLKKDEVTLDTALRDYATFKSDASSSEREIGQRVARLRKDLVEVYGRQKIKHVPLKEITRQDANDLRDHLLRRLSANSVARNLGVIRAAVNHVIVEQSLSIPNVFTNLKIKGAGASIEDRHPLTDEHIAIATPRYQGDPLAWALFVTLMDTGARLSEILGLEVQDVDLQARSITIRPNGIRGLKTKGSHRTLPLSRRAAEVLQGHRQGKEDGEAIFPKYARLRGSDAASAMMMKRLRTVITDRKLTMHSLRHRMKDKLRNTGCPEAISMAILGHGSNTVAANYGSGYALEVMREHMERVW